MSSTSILGRIGADAVQAAEIGGLPRSLLPDDFSRPVVKSHKVRPSHTADEDITLTGRFENDGLPDQLCFAVVNPKRCHSESPLLPTWHTVWKNRNFKYVFRLRGCSLGQVRVAKVRGEAA